MYIRSNLIRQTVYPPVIKHGSSERPLWRFVAGQPIYRWEIFRFDRRVDMGGAGPFN